MTKFVLTTMSSLKHGSALVTPRSEPGAGTRALQSYRTAALSLFQVLAEAMSVATEQVT